MSWLARSFANSLRLDGDVDDENDIVLDPPTTSSREPPQQQHEARENAFGSEEAEEEEDDDEETQERGGVKEDLDEIKETLTRQFWGMASFLAPPPSDSHSHSQSDPSSFVSDQSNHRAVSPNEELQLDEAAISNHSNSVSVGSDSEGDFGLEQRAVGITEEVLVFAMNIAMHPETWLDFPIDEEDDTDGNLFLLDRITELLIN